MEDKECAYAPKQDVPQITSNLSAECHMVSMCFNIMKNLNMHTSTVDTCTCPNWLLLAVVGQKRSAPKPHCGRFSDSLIIVEPHK